MLEGLGGLQALAVGLGQRCLCRLELVLCRLAEADLGKQRVVLVSSSPLVRGWAVAVVFSCTSYLPAW